MKKIQIYFYLFIIFLSLTTQAQTKEETIFWLKEYGLDMLNNNPFDYNDKWYYYIDDNKFRCNIIMLDGVERYKEFSFDCLANVYLEDIVVKKRTGQDWSEISISFQKNCFTSNFGYPLERPSIYFPLKNNTSQQDQERFLKAFKHLAKLCGAKEKPKVTKNTF